jgi:hypothetical protein
MQFNALSFGDFGASFDSSHGRIVELPREQEVRLSAPFLCSSSS